MKAAFSNSTGSSISGDAMLRRAEQLQRPPQHSRPKKNSSFAPLQNKSVFQHSHTTFILESIAIEKRQYLTTQLSFVL